MSELSPEAMDVLRKIHAHGLQIFWRYRVPYMTWLDDDESLVTGKEETLILHTLSRVVEVSQWIPGYERNVRFNQWQSEWLTMEEVENSEEGVTENYRLTEKARDLIAAMTTTTPPGDGSGV